MPILLVAWDENKKNIVFPNFIQPGVSNLGHHLRNCFEAVLQESFEDLCSSKIWSEDPSSNSSSAHFQLAKNL